MARRARTLAVRSARTAPQAPAIVLAGAWLVGVGLGGAGIADVALGAPGAGAAITVQGPDGPPPAPVGYGSIGPFLPPADPVRFPVLGYRGTADACLAWIHVQNLGAEAGKAVVAAWGPETACAPRCPAVLGVACSGLIAPGGSWRLAADALPGGVQSAVLFSFSARTLAEIGQPRPGDDPVVGDVLCGALMAALPRDCDAYARFLTAFETQEAFAGVALARAHGPLMAAEVQRSCHGDRAPSRRTTATYAGLSGGDLGGRDRVFDISAYHATLIAHGRDGWYSTLYVQNGGVNCASVELWLQEQDACRPSRPCKVFTLAPGTSRSVDVADCTAPGWEGAAWLNASEPLAVAIDVYGFDTLMTYVATPSELRYAWDGPPVFTAGSDTVYGPLIYAREHGWDTRVHVQNLNSRVAATVRVTFFSPAGVPIEVREPVWVCPYGSRAFRVPPVDRRPGVWVGSVRVESLPWPEAEPTPGSGTPAPGGPTPASGPPNIAAVAELVRHGGGTGDGSGAFDASLAYNLLPVAQATERGPGAPPPRGATRIGLPGLAARSDAAGHASRLAVANTVAAPGRTSFAVLLYDANGLVDARCYTLGPQAVAYVDLDAWQVAGSTFRGAAIVSATRWSHVRLDDAGRLADRPVGLAAVAVQELDPAGRSGDVGDAFAAVAGLAYRLEGPRAGSASPDARLPACQPPPPPVDRAWLPTVLRDRG